MKLLIKNGHVIDPKNEVDAVMDILLKDGKIAEVAKKIDEKCEIIDAEGLIVMPGLIDMHVHLREPGREDKETIATCARAAARGGITTVAGMPNSTPVADDQTVIRYVVSTAEKEAIVNVYPVGNITKGGKGKELSQIGDLKKAGAVALSDDSYESLTTGGIMRMAMQYMHKWKLPIIQHAEDETISGEWVMHEGNVSTRLGLAGKPAAAEEVAIARDIVLSELTGYPMHFTHVNSKGALAMIKDAKRRGIKVTCDTCPHYFTLTDEAVVGYDPMAKMNPPLRPEDHRQAVIKAIKDGTVDAISTDHAPHLLVEKYLEFDNCANGIVGLETSVPLVMTHLVKDNIIGYRQMAELMSRNPAQILKLDNKGHLGKGADADITMIDPAKKEKIDRNRFESKGRNTPFDGWDTEGVPVYTIVGGKVVMKDREIVG